LADIPEALRTALADHYALEREIGHGGMATVYLAEDLKHHRQVAIKVLRPEVAAMLGAERFLREIQIAAGLAHPHILPLHDSGTIEWTAYLRLPYYVMPYVSGQTLRRRLSQEQRLPVDEALEIARHVGAALSYAHSRGIVHRDIKPENILLEDGEAVVADFGIARAIVAAGDQRLTTTGLVVGTPTYMSPEQATGTDPIDGRTDQYSLGCVLYEMLTGLPPHAGASPQVMLARRLVERPRSVRAVRPSVPVAVDAALNKALAILPSDRFDNASTMIRALTPEPPAPRRRRWRIAAVTGLLAAALIAGALLLRSERQPGALDPSRVVVFPFSVAGGADANLLVAENATTAFLTALNGTGVLKGVDGWRLLDAGQVRNIRALSVAIATGIALRQRAGAFVLGSLIPGDSLRMTLELHVLPGDSSLLRTTAVDRAQGAWGIGLSAAQAVLPVLVLGTRGTALTEHLQGRSATSVASFLRGEQAYRRSQFARALTSFRSAVADDSAFAIAALRGAQTAIWNLRLPEAGELNAVALAHRSSLPARYTLFAEGLDAYLHGEADLAVTRFRRAVEFDPGWPEAWTALGEVYTHLLPADAPLDSLAEAAFREAHRLDPDFTPVLYHLTEIAARHGQRTDAERLLAAFRKQEPDSIVLEQLQLMLRCVGGSLAGPEWRRAAEHTPQPVFLAAAAFALGGVHQPACAEAGFRAVLQHDTAADAGAKNRRFAALLGLQNLLAAQGKAESVRRLFAADTVFGAQHGDLHILAAVSGAPFEPEAMRAAEELRKAVAARGAPVASPHLWFLGLWEARTGHADAVQRLADSLEARASLPGSDARLNRLLSASLTAWAALARGDTARAIALLSALGPNGSENVIAWSPWESLAAERVALARLRLVRQQYGEALRLARNFDAPSPLAYVLYAPAALSICTRSARALGDTRLAARCSVRFARLRGAGISALP
jgi:tetratricopeptide (TPR) repeat protein